jgi:hypothetical protein
MTDYTDEKLREFYVKALSCPYIQNAVVVCPFLKKHVDMCPWLSSKVDDGTGKDDPEKTALPPITSVVEPSGLMVPDPSSFYHSGRQ